MATAPSEVVKEIVKNEVLAVQGLNCQAFSGSTSPSTLYRMMVDNQPMVMPYYRELLEKDTCISSSLDVRKTLVLAREWNVVGADDEDGSALQMKDEASAFLREIRRFADILEELLDCIPFGYAVGEIFWSNDGNQIRCEKIMGRPQEFFDFRQGLIDVPNGELRYLQNMIPPGEQIPQEKFLVSTYQGRHGDRRGLPVLRRLFWASWFKRQALRLYLQFLEKGQGTIAVGYADAAGSEEKTKAQEAAQAIAEEIAVAIPSSMKIMDQLLARTRNHDGNDFRGLLDYQDSEMTRIILGQTLSTRGSEKGVGTQALGTVHQDLLFEIIKRDAANLSDVIDEQLLLPWGLWTFGPAFADRAYRPHFQIDVAPENDLLEQARALKEARGLVDIPLAYAYQKLGIPEAEEGEALVQAAQIPIEITGIPNE